jgi:hypothetical protein
LTEDLYVAGARSSFRRWADLVGDWDARSTAARDLTHIEDVSVPSARSKLRAMPDQEPDLLEVVLHNADSESVVLAFVDFATARGAEVVLDRRRTVRGLTFMPVRRRQTSSEDIAAFAFVRAVRGMPAIRPLVPPVARGRGVAIQLPDGPPIDDVSRAVIFDGGVPQGSRAALGNWVTVVEPPNIGAPVPGLEDHGLAVTAAFLFGPLDSTLPAGQPPCRVDHVRVLDDSPGTSDFMYVDVLDRIVTHLDENLGRYDFVNLSLGPDLPVEDDDVNLWTASLDRRLAHGRAVVTVAVGNTGEGDPAAGLNRIQPPSDAVNVLSVGAADRRTGGWQRATYSSVGPGRSPGLIKPDGVAFGGSDDEPFGVLSRRLGVVSDTGTSYSAPIVLRVAAEVRALLGSTLSALAIRALLIHRAEVTADHQPRDVGWGLFESDATRLVTCEDDEVLVAYQGELPVGEHLRVPVPMPAGGMTGTIELAGTLVIAPEVDPDHPGAYTRSGLEVAFRPHSGRFGRRADGRRPEHAKTRPFFSSRLLYGASEASLREDGHKWEPCLRSGLSVGATTLHEPVFDIYYHSRQAASVADDPQPIPYAFIVGVRARSMPDLYSQVVRAYASVLQPLQPQLRLRLQP